MDEEKVSKAADKEHVVTAALQYLLYKELGSRTRRFMSCVVWDDACMLILLLCAILPQHPRRVSMREV